jgi:hypothetical protein
MKIQKTNAPPMAIIYAFLFNFGKSSTLVDRLNMHGRSKASEGQETGAIAPAPENARKKFEGRGRLRQ